MCLHLSEAYAFLAFLTHNKTTTKARRSLNDVVLTENDQNLFKANL